MGKGDYLGEFEFAVLAIVASLGHDDAYGMQIRLEIEERTGRGSSIGAVYATLRRLESKGYVESRMGEPTPERGGRAKRHFALTAAGETALRATREMMDALWEGLPEEL